MSDDDDWFERALREDEDAESDADPDSEAARSPDSPSDGAEFDASEGGGFAGDDEPGGGGGDESGRSGFGGGDASDADPSPTGFADAEPYDAGDSPDGSGSSEAATGGDPSDSDDADLFDEDFASAFENAPGGGAGTGGSMPGGDDPPGGFGGESPGGFGDGGGSVDDFGGGGGFGPDASDGFGGGFGDSDDSFEEDFDDEEFESSIPRIDVGIEGLDSMVQGGVPERSLMTTIGSAGTGKTTFGLQFLHEALRQDENAVFITLEESKDRIVDTATEKGWAFDEYVEEDRLAVIDLDPIEMANSLTSISNDLPRLVEEFGATRLVLDSVSLLEMMYDDQATRRNEVYDFTKSLKEAGVTTMLTSEASQDTPYASRHGIIEYLVDAVFVLQYIRGSDDFRETRLAVEIQKIRDANHSREIKPYAITNEGISVYRQANIF
ncbi:KaiC domain-containing protein [Halorussus halobius]|uniref:KaiC domain-containing protein n=1 Tax=Halorussus halobius TaxID=1710537 RepID=UPI0010932489|nr:KaiC domain-containing protein [Halorussus halobius]